MARLDWRVLRAAIDWARLLYVRHVSAAVWAHLASLAGGDGGLLLPCGGIALALRVRVDRTAVVLWGDGVRVVVNREWQLPPQRRTRAADPERAQLETAEYERACTEAARDRQRYGVEVDVQGAALSASNTGRDVVDAVRLAVERLCWPELPEGERRAELTRFTFPGRFDLCLDCNATGSDADAWVEGSLYCNGDLDRARAQWSSRARSQKMQTPDADDEDEAHLLDQVEGRCLERWNRPAEHPRTALVGTQPKGRTFYIGSVALLRVYERDRLTSGDWRTLRPTLERCGWKTGRMVRVEWEIKREWLRDQVFEWVDGTSRRGNTLTLDEWLEALPLIARALWERYRHTTRDRRGDDAPVRRRPTSPFWWAVFDGLALLQRADEPGALARMRSVQRAVSAERARERAARGVRALMQLGPDGRGPVEQREAVAAVVAVLNDPARREQWAEYDARLRFKNGLARVVEVHEATG